MPADLLIYNANALTQDPAQPQAEALAIQNGKIIGVGRKSDLENLVNAQTRQIDLGGRTLIPGFNDAHVHIWKVGHLLTSLLDLRGVTSIPEMQSKMRAFGEKLAPDAWFMGRGYNEALMIEGRHPTRADLDAVFGDRPAYLIRTCAHIAVANSAALRLAGVTAETIPPSGGVIELGADGQPNGILHETALGLVANHIPEPSAADYEAMLIAAAKHQIALGITSATDPGVMPNLLAVYRNMDERGALLNRVNVMAIRRPDGGTQTLDLPIQHESDFLRVDTIKFFADGGLSGATAALSVPYQGLDSQGVLRFEAAELYDLARDAQLNGLRIATHAIGDVALDLILTVYEKLAALGGNQRHRIEHFGLPDAALCERARALGVIVAPQAIFIGALGPNFRRYLPPQFLARCYPLRMMLDAGLTLALSSDAPVVKDDNPLRGLQAAITRRDFQGELIAPDQAISAAEGLYAYTMGGAIASGDSQNRGSLSAGKWADMAVLSGDPLTTPPESLDELKVEMTFIGGEIVYEG